MKQPPATPGATVLFVVGPQVRTDMAPDPYTVADYVKAQEQLQALGYNVISLHGLPPATYAEVLAKCHGVATTDQFTEQNAGATNMGLLKLAYALNMPDLPVISWAKAAAPDAHTWYAELWEGSL